MQLGTNSLKQRLRGAAGWVLAGYGMSQLLRLGSSLILTRLLAPDMYGIMSVGYMVVTAFWTMSDIGLGPLAIQNKRGEDPRFLNVVWLVQVARGAVIMSLTLAAAAAFYLFADDWFAPGSVYADSRIPAIFAVVAFYGLIAGFDSTRVYLARRYLSLGVLTRIEILSQVVSTLFIIVWAWLAPSVIALAAGWVVGALVRAVLTHRLLPGPPNRFEWDPQVFRSIVDFGKWTIASSTLSFLLTSGDRLLLGLYLDSTAMGHFAIAMVLFGAVHAVVSKLIGEAALPALSEVVRERPQQLRSTFYKIRLPIDAVCAGGAGALVFLAPWVVRLLYDPRYAPAGWMLAILGLVLLSTRLNVFDQCMVAQARMRFLTALNAVRMLVLFVAVPWGHEVGGARGAIIAVAVAAFLNGGVLLFAQWRSNLLELRRELLAVPLFAVGLAAGYGLSSVLELGLAGWTLSASP